MELIVGLNDIRHLLTAWATPACPEVNKHVVALAYPLTQLHLLVVHVVHGQIFEHDTWTTKLQRCQLCLC